MDFEAYCTSKKIDHLKFNLAEPERYGRWQSEFLQVHPNNFTSQKLFYINEVRRRYPLAQKSADHEILPKTSFIPDSEKGEEIKPTT